jgi:hypothetical protein
MLLGMFTKIEIVINIRSEFEVCVYDPRRICRSKEIFYLADLYGQRETAGFRGGRAGESVGFPNV